MIEEQVAIFLIVGHNVRNKYAMTDSNTLERPYPVISRSSKGMLETGSIEHPTTRFCRNTQPKFNELGLDFTWHSSMIHMFKLYIPSNISYAPSSSLKVNSSSMKSTDSKIDYACGRGLMTLHMAMTQQNYGWFLRCPARLRLKPKYEE
ncbi:hypothetical protein QJS10_CPB22g00304 [Acorus calamus]|uniref:Uncharacterized protein n=1 Tax=Acorus calamus TaxID=4465 RepID=A0AAV9BZ07_ACOCL|nr:hypothetical protein QJS10_CPB22g00304 [Acorus calamus]